MSVSDRDADPSLPDTPSGTTARSADAGGTASEAPPRDGDSDASIIRTGGSIALATLISRITGFVRTILVLAMLGPAIASAFQAAYVLPNMIAEVVLGAVLTAIVIPSLARAESDPDGGRDFINRIFTLSLVVLGTATVLALIAAPVLTYLNVGDGDVNRPLTTALAYLLLPEILFYGLTALFIAVLNMRGYFKPGAWAPVLNNIVQIATLVLYALMPGEISLDPVRMGEPKLLVLGIGTTLGVVMQVAILVPYLRRAGVQFRLRWGIDARLRRFGNMAMAIIAYVLMLQVGFFVTYRIAAHADASGISVYATQWQLLQLPYGVLGVTILTAIMPRLSRHAAADDNRAVTDDLSLATRLTMVALVPVVAFMTFFGPAIGLAVFNFGKFDADVATQLGATLAWGAFTIIPYAMTLVQLRVFYARDDGWTPTAIAVGITAVKVAFSYLGPVLFSDPDMIVRWLAFSNGLGYLAGAIVGHYLLRSRLGNVRLTHVARTTVLTIATSIGVAAVVWLIARVSGLHLLGTDAGKIGSLAYLALTGIVVLGVTYALLAAWRVPDVVDIGNSLRRMFGRFIPALAPPPGATPDTAASITVQFPGVTDAESLPYSGQVQVLRRFDRGTATWQSYSVHSGGAAGRDLAGQAPVAQRSGTPPDMRYRRRGVRRVSESRLDAQPEHTGSSDDPTASSDDTPTRIVPSVPDPAAGTAPSPDTAVPEALSDAVADAETPPGASDAGSASATAAAPDGDDPVAPVADPDQAEPVVAPRRRGPRLVPGAAVAGGRYRLLEPHGGTRGLRFWRALDINLDRDVALTFVDADQLAPPPARGESVRANDSGPQGVLTRTLRLGQLSSAGVARVLDVVRGSSGGIVVAEWVPGSSLSEVARSHPSPIGAARAVRALAAAAESAHRSGSSLSVDHPDRIRISTDGNAVLAFPGTLAGDDKSSDVRGLGAVLYALLLARWPLDGDTGSELVTTAETTEPVGGLPIAEPGPKGGPIEPIEADPAIPFEISAVAARALDGTRGIRTAATVQHVLDQATVVDLKTDMLPAIDGDTPPVSVSPPPASSARRRLAELPEGRRNMALLVGAGLLALFGLIALVVWLSSAFGGSGGPSDIDSILNTTSAPAPPPAPAGAQQQASGNTPVVPQSVSLVDVSTQPPDSTANIGNVITGAAPPWRTDNYRSSPTFAGLKQGLGLMFDLGSAKAVSRVTIDSPTPGFTVELRTAPGPNPTLAQTTQVAGGTVDRPTTTLTVNNPRPTRYLMVWLTSLPAAPTGGYQAAIGHVTMSG
ncbi:hypothetical protein GCM10009624_35540 [Gordonia sinesedis]